MLKFNILDDLVKFLKRCNFFIQSLCLRKFVKLNSKPSFVCAVKVVNPSNMVRICGMHSCEGHFCFRISNMEHVLLLQSNYVNSSIVIHDICCLSMILIITSYYIVVPYGQKVKVWPHLSLVCMVFWSILQG